MASHGTEQTPAERIAQARAHRQAGRYAAALALLSGSEQWPQPENETGTVLRARILARTDPVQALALLAGSQDLYESTEGRFGYYAVSMRAYIGTRNFDGAAAMSELAGALEDGVTPENKIQLWHFRAQLRHALEQYDPLDDNIAALLASDDPNGRFLGLLVRSYMYAGLERYADQVNDLTAALEVAGSHPGACDPYTIALQVHALLRLGLETGDAAAVAAGASAYEWMPWSEDLKNERFLCVRALAWDAFLRGESAQAQWLLKDSKALATTQAWKVMAHLDRAYIARMNGNEHWAAEELASAHSIARNVEWSATQGEERQALVMLAVLFSPADMAQAQHYVSIYMQLGRGGVDPTLALSHDQRAVAFEKYALGRVHQVLGNDSLSVKSFETAYAIFEKAGYRFRAALAAMGLFESTRDEYWLDAARRNAETFPRSALRTTLNQKGIAVENAHLRDLTPMQRQIAFALCEGLDLADLSHRFSRSAFTLGKHVEVVYERLGVKNRNALRATLQGWTYL